MKKKFEYISAKEGFIHFLFESTNTGTLDKITSWVQKHLIDKNPDISKEEKSAFFEAEKGVLEGFLRKGEIRKFQDLLEVFNDFTKDNSNFKKLEFKVFTDALKGSKEFVVKHGEYHDTIKSILDSFGTIHEENQELTTRFEEVISLLGELSSSSHLLDLDEGSSTSG
ncbi:MULTISPECIES: hypothetical protein [Rickettsieae]|uniref:hypothetical protein n=1 Tax=Rickettsieae TaxID=33988 RepID=UPI000B9C0B8F|nr:hypothetical protein [Rickettsia endosymbiont of Culicoides newsteadi]OZG31396.1 hypothetical protein RiCNE_12120 [Rickettsia endosymbiont of Culicoides newsteadi]